MGIFHNFNRGIQIVMHAFRMLKQGLKTIFIWTVITWLLAFAFSLWKDHNPANYHAFFYYGKATISLEKTLKIPSLKWREIEKTPRRVPTKNKVKAKGVHISFASERNGILLSKERVKEVCERRIKVFFQILLDKAKRALWFSAFVFALFFLGGVLKGIKVKKKTHLGGLPLAKAWKLKLRLKCFFKASDITIGGVPMLKKSEATHMLITGCSGSGKTNCLRQLLCQIRTRGDRAVIVDTTGCFVSEFFKEEKDILLNPFDVRTRDWHPWAECSNLKFQNLAYNFVPSVPSRPGSEDDNFFKTGARNILISALEEAAISKNFSISKFLKTLLKDDLESLYKRLKGTSASVYLDPKGERMTLSVRATLSNFVSGLMPLKDTDHPFSIRDWVIKEQAEPNWLFLSSTPQDRKELKTLLSAWGGIAFSSLQERGESNKNKNIWLIFDELHALQKLEYLEGSLAETRKYEGCIVLATQNLSQLDKIYGHHEAASIIDQCGTKVCFRQNNRDLAKRMSGFFGEVQTKESQEGISYGANEIRDGVNLSSIEKVRPSVSSTDILSLKNLQSYLKLPETIPPTKVRFRFLKKKIITDAYIEDEGFYHRKKKELEELQRKREEEEKKRQQAKNSEAEELRVTEKKQPLTQTT